MTASCGMQGASIPRLRETACVTHHTHTHTHTHTTFACKWCVTAVSGCLVVARWSANKMQAEHSIAQEPQEPQEPQDIVGHLEALIGSPGATATAFDCNASPEQLQVWQKVVSGI